MTSAISTSSIDGNYPTPGVNNSTQGFRDNFTSIKKNLVTAATEITDLQKNVLVKGALSGTTMNNDMNNGIISNVQTLGFRASTYNLGTNLSGVVTVDCTLGDVHYGTIDAGDAAITLEFTKWAPAGTQGRVEVILTVAAGQVITLPGSVTQGLNTIYGYNVGSYIVTIPGGVTQVHWVFTSMDCGSTIEIMPVIQSRKAVQVQRGLPVDVAATITANIFAGNANITFESDVTGSLTTANIVNNTVLVTGSGIKIGTISAAPAYNATSNITTITLSSAPTVTLVDEIIHAYSLKGSAGDQMGMVRAYAGNLYLCSQDYSSASSANIWVDLGSTGGSGGTYGNVDVSSYLATITSNIGNVSAVATARPNVAANVANVVTANITTANIGTAYISTLGTSTNKVKDSHFTTITTDKIIADTFNYNTVSFSSSVTINGNITATGNSVTTGNITATTGSITATAGNLTAGNGITATSGNITATAGNIMAGGNITTATGYIQGKIITTTSITGFTYSSGSYTVVPAGIAGQIVVDTTNSKLLVCTTTGNATGGTTPIATWKSTSLV